MKPHRLEHSLDAVPVPPAARHVPELSVQADTDVACTDTEVAKRAETHHRIEALLHPRAIDDQRLSSGPAGPISEKPRRIGATSAHIRAMGAL